MRRNRNGINRTRGRHAEDRGMETEVLVEGND